MTFKNGNIIILEGPRAVGKSTQAAILRDRLNNWLRHDSNNKHTPFFVLKTPRAPEWLRPEFTSPIHGMLGLFQALELSQCNVILDRGPATEYVMRCADGTASGHFIMQMRRLELELYDKINPLVFFMTAPEGTRMLRTKREKEKVVVYSVSSIDTLWEEWFAHTLLTVSRVDCELPISSISVVLEYVTKSWIRLSDKNKRDAESTQLENQ